MVTEKSASCYNQEQSSRKITEKGFSNHITSNCGSIPQILTFKDEMTVKAQHRHGQASGEVSGGSASTQTSSHNVHMHIKLWQKKKKDTQKA